MARKRYSDEDALNILCEIDVHLHDAVAVRTLVAVAVRTLIDIEFSTLVDRFGLFNNQRRYHHGQKGAERHFT